jgi:hypothetical protein
MRRAKTIAVAVAMAAASAGCSSNEPTPSPPCEDECKDGVALRALREMMKFAYNTVVQGKPVGPQDGIANLFLSGSAHVFGSATSDPLMGTTTVGLTYEFANAHYVAKDDSPEQNYDIVIDGTLWQEGTIAIQPSATTALFICGVNVHLVGKVYDPPLPYGSHQDLDAGAPETDASVCKVGMTQNPDGGAPETDESACAVLVTQSGSDVGGYFCGRKAGFRF